MLKLRSVGLGRRNGCGALVERHGQNRKEVLREKLVPVPITDPTRTKVRLNPGFWGERPETNRLRHGKAGQSNRHRWKY